MRVLGYFAAAVLAATSCGCVLAGRRGGEPVQWQLTEYTADYHKIEVRTPAAWHVYMHKVSEWHEGGAEVSPGRLAWVFRADPGQAIRAPSLSFFGVLFALPPPVAWDTHDSMQVEVFAPGYEIQRGQDYGGGMAVVSQVTVRPWTNGVDPDEPLTRLYLDERYVEAGVEYVSREERGGRADGFVSWLATKRPGLAESRKRALRLSPPAPRLSDTDADGSAYWGRYRGYWLAGSAELRKRRHETWRAFAVEYSSPLVIYLARLECDEYWEGLEKFLADHPKDEHVRRGLAFTYRYFVTRAAAVRKANPRFVLPPNVEARLAWLAARAEGLDPQPARPHETGEPFTR